MSRGLFWFRSDLRIKDNPALKAACSSCKQLVIIYIYNPKDKTTWAMGSASKWWLHHSLSALQDDLNKRDVNLQIIQGEPNKVIFKLCEKLNISQVFWNRVYEPEYITRDKKLKNTLKNNNIKVKSYNASLLNEPWDILKNDGTPYRVFTPYWKMVQKNGLNFTLEKNIKSFPKNIKITSDFTACNIDSLKLLPTINWDDMFYPIWKPGEHGAQKSFNKFLKSGLSEYEDGRNLPAENLTSKVSPYLHFGEISSRQIVASVQNNLKTNNKNKQLISNANSYIREIAWREFSYHLLFHFPQTVDVPLNHKFSRFPWAKRYTKDLHSWQQGKTGIPLVDAGMRELWNTGWMHNRVRMVVGSFLTKNLLIPWQIGSKWFWDTLVDADLANNTLGWQWIAGCGADAAPYYRIFNPVLQSKKFDKDGKYIRKWVPELNMLPSKLIHSPWECPAEVLKQHGIVLGLHYPKPIVDLKTSRETALAAYNKIK